MEKIIEFINIAANKLNSNKTIIAVSRGIIAMVAALMLGSFSTLLRTLPFDAWQSFIHSNGLFDLFGMLINVTNGLIALHAAFSIANVYAKNEELDGYTSGLLAVVSFLLLTPMTVTEGGGFTGFTTNLPLTNLGATGLFTAMIVSIVSAKIYCFLMKKKITIKMPESVPPFVSSAIGAIIPTVLIAVFFATVSMLVSLTDFASLNDMVQSLIAMPLGNLGGTIWVAMFIYFLSGLCWFVGIHGVAVISVMIPLWFTADQMNIAAVAAGYEPTNIITFNWLNNVQNMGGAGATLGLVILCAFFAKSQRYKKMGKITLIPSLFNINEPVVFGMPMMLNVLMFIPFVFLPVILIGVAYVLTITGILPIGNGIGAPAGVPVILMGTFIGGWRMALWQLCTLVISIAVYFPFFKIMDRKACEEEADVNTVESIA